MGMQAGFAQPGMGMQPGMGIQPGASMGYMPGERCFCLMLDLANLDVVPGMGGKKKHARHIRSRTQRLCKLHANPDYSAHSQTRLQSKGCQVNV